MIKKLGLQLPKSKDEIALIQSERKKIAFARAKKANFYQGKLDHIDPGRLDEAEEWAKIPIIDKETLRNLGVDNFADLFRSFFDVSERLHEVSERLQSVLLANLTGVA